MDGGFGIFDKTGAKESVAASGACEATDVGFGAVWSARCDPAGIIRMDAKTHVVDQADIAASIVDSEASVGAGEGAVWVVAGDDADHLLKIDPKTLKVVATYPIPQASAGVRAGLGGIWITRPLSGELIRVDPATGKWAATIHVGQGPRFLAVGEGAVWVMNQTDGSVSRIDPKTNKVTATTDVGSEIHGGDITVGGGSVWVRGGPWMLARIDPATNLTVQRYGPEVGSGSAAADDDAAWISAHDVAKIWRLPLRVIRRRRRPTVYDGSGSIACLRSASIIACAWARSFSFGCWWSAMIPQ